MKNKKNLNEQINEISRLMSYDRSRTLVEQSNTFQPDEIFGNCVNTFVHFTPKIKSTDNLTQKINQYSKTIGESFSYKMYQQSGWGSSDLFTKCKDGKLSLSENFSTDIKRYNQDKVSLNNKPYFCYNQNASNMRWSVKEIDNDLGVPNYLSELSKEFGTYDVCKINQMFKLVPKFDWKGQMDKEWSTIAHIALPVLATILVISPAAPVSAIVLSGLIELADIMLYVREQDFLTASIATAFLVIPGGQLLKKIPAVEEFTSKTLGPAIKKIINKLPLNTAEKKLQAQILENQNWIRTEYAKYANQVISTGSKVDVIDVIEKFGSQALIILVLRLVKLGVWSTKWTIRVVVGGVSVIYTILQLAKKLEEKFGKIKELDSFEPKDLILTSEQKDQSVDEVYNQTENVVMNVVDAKINEFHPDSITWGDDYE